MIFLRLLCLGDCVASNGFRERCELKPLNGMTNVRHLIGVITSHLVGPINYVEWKFLAVGSEAPSVTSNYATISCSPEPPLSHFEAIQALRTNI